MTEVTVQLPDDVAVGATRWLPVIVSLNRERFQTQAAVVVNEISRFFLSGPAASVVLEFRPSPAAQERLQRLLVLNQAGLLSEEENLELDELEQIEHFLRMTKLRLLEQLNAN